MLRVVITFVFALMLSATAWAGNFLNQTTRPNATIRGNYGSLTIYYDGSYTYAADSQIAGLDSGEEVSTREVKKILQDLISTEDKKNPWTDESLAKELKTKGYNIARRTVAKYREQLDMPVARLRKEL